MVPRERGSTAPHTSRHSVMRWVFEAWRLVLSRLVAWIARTLRTALRVVLLLARLASGRTTAEEIEPSTALRLASGALATGVVLATAYTAPRVGIASALASALVGAAWAVARLIVMRTRAASAQGAARIDSSTVSVAWAAGAVFYALAVTPQLRWVAWAAGAVASYRTASRTAPTPKAAMDVVAWGYGVEAAGFAVVWLLRSLAVLVFFAG